MNMELEKVIEDLISYDSEEEWFEFKTNWYDPNGIGEYISSLSNAAALKLKPFGYLVWGIENNTHKVVGTTFSWQQDLKNEPLQHFLARRITPDVNFSFEEIQIEGSRIVVLTIPAAKTVPTAYDNVRYIRIGSSKANLNKYPERESYLFSILRNGAPTMENTPSKYQELSFKKLFLYYLDKGIELKENTFKKNLGLLTEDGKYNILAQVLSDNSHIPIRVSIFLGTDKSAQLYSVKEFGENCLLYSLDKVLDYGDTINIMQADEKGRRVVRKEVPLFNLAAFREAMINAFVHNLWISQNAPMITVYTDRVEILSRGELPPLQTREGFYLGESVPVNQGLSDIFLQLHISERSGRGVPQITKIYGRHAFTFRENSIVVDIPFSHVANDVTEETDADVETKRTKRDDNKDSENLPKIAEQMLLEIRNNPNITHPQLAVTLHVGRTTVQKYISYLKKEGYIKRVGSNKRGYWIVNE